MTAGPCARVELKAQIERGIGPVGALHFDDGRLGFGRQFGAHLLQARGDFGQRRRAAVVELQPDGDGADAGAAGRFDVVDAADRARRPARSASSGSREPSRRSRQ